MIPRLDLAFSYWIFAWYLLYIYKIIKYNPLFFLIIALIENVIYLLLLIYYKNSFIYILLFILINFFIKVIPVWTLYKTTIKMIDIGAGILLFFIYACWLLYNNKLNQYYFIHLLNSIKKGTPVSPILSALFTTKSFRA